MSSARQRPTGSPRSAARRSSSSGTSTSRRRRTQRPGSRPRSRGHGSRSGRTSPTCRRSSGRPTSSGCAGVPRRAVTPPTHAALRYVALGDSYTIGTALDSADGALAGPARRAAAVRRRAPLLELVGNLGVNGFTSGDVIDVELPQLGRLRARVRVAARRGQRRRPGRSGRDVRGERGGDPRHAPRTRSSHPGS